MRTQSRDYLTGLPAEVLVHIFSHFPISDFLELGHIHPIIRDVFKNNAAQICNLAIENDPELKSRAHSVRVNATKINKWPIPERFPIRLDYVLARRVLTKKVFKRIGTPKEMEVSEASFPHPDEIDMTWNKMGMKIKLDEPGPAFLCFLEWQRNEHRVNAMMQPATWGCIQYPHLCGLWTMRFLTSHEEKALAIRGFADTFRKKWFPKELLWFYGIEAIEKDMESE